MVLICTQVWGCIYKNLSFLPIRILSLCIVYTVVNFGGLGFGKTCYLEGLRVTACCPIHSYVIAMNRLAMTGLAVICKL